MPFIFFIKIKAYSLTLKSLSADTLRTYHKKETAIQSLKVLGTGEALLAKKNITTINIANKLNDPLNSLILNGEVK